MAFCFVRAPLLAVRAPVLALAYLTPCVFWLASGRASVAETTNVRISTRWLDDTALHVRRQDESGAWETVSVDLQTGVMQPAEDASGDPSSLRGGRVPRSGPSDESINITFQNDSEESVALYWVDSTGRRTRYQAIDAGSKVIQHTYATHVWEVVGEGGTYYGHLVATKSESPIVILKEFPRPRRSSRSKIQANEKVRFDGRMRIREGDSWRELELDDVTASERESITSPSLSPDGSVVAAWIREPVTVKPVHTIRSSPRRGGRAELISRPYLLPGDPMDRYRLAAWNVESGKRLELETPSVDFGRPSIRWRSDHELIYEKVDRGHQRFRTIVVDPISGTVRNAIDESTETFIWTTHGPSCPLTTYLEGNDHVIYASEQSGYRHLSLIDLSGQSPARPLTHSDGELGQFLVRRIIHVDEPEGYLDLEVGCLYDDQDPYHRHLMRVHLDGGHMIPLTDADGDHEYEFSPDRKFVVVSHSRVDRPPVHELRRCDDGKLVTVLAEAVRRSTHPLPIRFVAKARDGETDIWGFVCFPKNIDPEEASTQEKASLPIIEAIYAGPHDAHVPKRYRDSPMYQEWTDLGFAVVKIDGMGTANRSKAFHDVCWKNLKDAGFPDRINWIKSLAKTYPILDVDRVGIFGTSAGGQNACGALLFHGDFYKAAMASCGCHDNRMDKASWNEQWMGYPVASHYADSSNIDQAHRLTGNLLLLVGELDSNVPPESTLRLVDALIKADKRFEFLMIPGMGHSDGGNYGRKLAREFFVRHLKPPMFRFN